MEAPVVQPANIPVPPPVPFHQEFAQHHGLDPAGVKTTFDAMSPEQMATTKAWHQEQLEKKDDEEHRFATQSLHSTQETAIKAPTLIICIIPL